jgi:hypothetical protein
MDYGPVLVPDRARMSHEALQPQAEIWEAAPEADVVPRCWRGSPRSVGDPRLHSGTLRSMTSPKFARLGGGGVWLRRVEPELKDALNLVMGIQEAPALPVGVTPLCLDHRLCHEV